MTGTKTVCFTGHRPKNLCGYDHDKYVSFVEQLKAVVVKLIEEENVTCFITGGAQGMDQLAFWAVNAVRSGKYDGKKRPEIQNIVYEPFETYGSSWANRGLFSKSEYNLMKRLATETVTLNKTPERKYNAVKLLNERNHAMVDNADIVVALYNGQDWSLKSTRSGTAECMRYAMKNNKTIHQIEYASDKNGNLKAVNM